MSKLGKKTILLPKESTIKVDGGTLLVSGPKGSKNIPFNEKFQRKQKTSRLQKIYFVLNL